MKVYAQMWSLRDLCDADFKDALEKVKTMGYDGVELAGYYGLDANELKGFLDDLGLEVLSAHVAFDLLKDDLENQIRSLKILGGTYIVCPWSDMTSPDSAKEIAIELSEIGKITKEAGLPLLYHNHAHEFISSDEIKAIDVFYDCVNSEYVLQEPDIFWIEHSGCDLLSYLKTNKSRMPVVHLKQMRDSQEKKQCSGPEGIIDFKEVMTILPQSSYIYEQEFSDHDIIEDMKTSLVYIKALF